MFVYWEISEASRPVPDYLHLFLAPVSYTHLGSSVPPKFLRTLANHLRTRWGMVVLPGQVSGPCSVQTVSYTHLDVYKRQDQRTSEN